MPKHNNRAALSSRLAKRLIQTDPRRSNLLAEILEESSSIKLNDGSNQTSARQALEDHSRLLNLIEELKRVEQAHNPKLPCRDKDSWTKFFNWIDSELTSDGTKVNLSTRVDVAKQSEDEYALIAKSSISKDEQLFSIHRKVMLSTETAAKDVDLYEFIRKDSIASAMQNVVLVLHLLNEYSKGEKSYWAPYLAILPNKPLPVLEMDKEKLKHLLPSSHMSEALKMIRAIARQYSYFYKHLESTNLPLSKDFTLNYYIWGVSIVCSRQNEIPPQDRRSCISSMVHALIPILDMCNHDYRSTQATFESNQSRLIATRDIAVNEEITINYGSRTSGEFYIHNGFVPEHITLDAVPLTIALNKLDNLYEAKLKLLKVSNMPTFGRFRLTRNDYENRHRRDPHLTMFLIVYFLNEEEIKLLTTNDNPIGIADEIYEYIQYHGQNFASKGNTANDKGILLNSSMEVAMMKERLDKCIRSYLSRRASISIAVIQRTLKENAEMDKNTALLLQHECSIYESYLINCRAE